MDREPRQVDGNNEFRMDYTVDDEHKSVLWKPRAQRATREDFVKYLMKHELPNCKYEGETGKGMDEVLRRNKIIVLPSSELNYCSLN